MKKKTAQNKKALKELKRDYLSFLRRVALTATPLLLLFGVFCPLWRVQGQDMFPTVCDGDLLLTNRLDRQRSRGDVVLYEAEGQRRVGRIVARESDLVEMAEDGQLLVNNAISSEKGFNLTEMEQEGFSVKVPEGCVFILGDHRAACQDSRDFGPVPVNHVKGKVIGVLRIRDF